MSGHRIYFSYNCESDLYRAVRVKDTFAEQGDGDEVVCGFWEPDYLDHVKREGRLAIIEMISRELKGANVTVVLIGKDTYLSRWVEYGIRKSHVKGKALLGIYINNIEDEEGRTDAQGRNPFELIVVNDHGRRVPLSCLVPIFDWVSDHGERNLSGWLAQAMALADD